MFSFRRPAIDEAAALAKLHVQCWHEAYTSIVPADLVARFDDAQMILRWQGHLQRPERLVIAAYLESQTVAFINAGTPVEKLHDDMDGHIAALYVAEAHYRRGLGRRLLAMAAQDWLDKGGHSLTLGVLAANTRARAFYEAMDGELVKTGLYDWHGYQLQDAIYVFRDLRRLAATI